MAGPQAFAVLFLAFLGLLGATHAFLAATPSTSNAVAVSTSRRYSGITDLYTAEDLPPERRKLMLVSSMGGDSARYQGPGYCP